ncbi:AAA family ATPase [Nonomuraea thailandensis]
MLHGRERECALIARLLDGARERRSAVLVVRGEAGIGKSALLGYAAGRADGMRVLRGGGVESESELPYAAAHQLLHPVADRLAAIPAGQAAALRAAFGLGDPVEGDRFLVSVAVLSLLSEVAEERPLLCLVDDAHWLDGASADALAFVARRLEAEGSCCCSRHATRNRARPALRPSRAGLPHRRFRAAHRHRRFGHALPHRYRAAVRGHGSPSPAGGAARAAVTRAGRRRGPGPAGRAHLRGARARRGRPARDQYRGQPLGLLELPGSLSAEQLAGTRPLPERLPVGEVVEQVFLSRVRRLTPPHRPCC